MTSNSPRCDHCGDVGCKAGQPGKFKYCPTNISGHDRAEIVKRYNDPELQKLMGAAAKVERGTLQTVNGVRTPIRPRISEIMAFADEMGWTRIGVAFCLAARDEALRLTKVLEARGFEVYSIICRAFGMTKGEVGIPAENCLKSPDETVCNPVYQAELLNDADTQLNIVVGLCVGHDMLFNKHSNAYVTTLMVKDRMTGNNPVGPLYSNFFSAILKQK
ncbi:MAG: DUF1847 domain-containing protein [Euryarchaeota archaeon]|jgi:uncharacterized metal-binding protein|nr:DUF1847 domain-containing protein [Euryarchaeota archaeon]